jgi:hypothetical protein
VSGLAFAYSISSAKVRAGTSGWTTSTFCIRITPATGMTSRTKLNFSLSYISALMAFAALAISSVYPSAAALITISVAMLVATPGRFSITTDCLSRSDSHWPIRRAVMSVAPPGA